MLRKVLARDLAEERPSLRPEQLGDRIGRYRIEKRIGEGGFGVGLGGRAVRTGDTLGGAQNHQGGHGHLRGDRPVGDRAASAGDDESSEHGGRSGGDRSGPAVPRHGTGQGDSDHLAKHLAPTGARLTPMDTGKDGNTVSGTPSDIGIYRTGGSLNTPLRRRPIAEPPICLHPRS